MSENNKESTVTYGYCSPDEMASPHEASLVAMCERFQARAEKAEAELRRMRTIAEWAQNAPHHFDCNPNGWTPRVCTCGRDEALGSFGGDRG